MIALIPLSLILSFFTYRKVTLPRRWTKVLLITLRALTLALIFILLLNPQIKQKSVSLEYPELSVLIDESRSITDSAAIRAIYENWQSDKPLNDRFDVHWYGFGQGVHGLDQLDFEETETNIGQAVTDIDRILGERSGPILVITDGQQTIGPSYVHYKSKYRPIYPIITGDTIWPEDLSIQRITANPVVRKGQPFEVEIVLNRSGSTRPIETQLEAYQNGRKIKSIDIDFSIGSDRKLVKTELSTDLIGVQSFDWRLVPISGEQITDNNSASLVVEGIDEQRRILLVYERIHPDIGTLSRGLSTDERTEVILTNPRAALDLLEDIDAVILYQPDKGFSELMTRITKESINVWLIAGPETLWSAVTAAEPALKKDVVGVSDALFARPNTEFSLFKSPWNRWDDLPPLISDIGQVRIETAHEVLLAAELQNQDNNSVQLGFFERNGVRWIVWDGVAFWRWRVEAHRLTQSHESFDLFLGILAKYISKHQVNNVLKLNYKPVYTQMVGAEFYAQYLDKTDALDLSASLEIRMTHQQTKQVITRPLLADTKQYKLNLSDLNPGIYDFTVVVRGTQNQKSGRFEIAPKISEAGRGYAKIRPMARWAELNEVPLHDLSQMGQLKEYLLSQNEFLPRETTAIKNLDFIRWYYALALLILMSSLEWFVRKYNGLT